MELKKEIIEDFNRIAEVEKEQWNHNNHYYRYLMNYLPSNRDIALEIGCGSGEMTRLMAGEFNRVIGIDISEEMLKKAEKLSVNHKNIEYLNEDIMEYPLEQESVDCITSTAVMHHLPMEEVIIKCKSLLKRGGVLQVLDLYETSELSEVLLSLAAVPLNIACMLIKNKRLRQSEEERLAWDQHSIHDKYKTFKEIKAICDRLLPGAVVKRHLFWRYSIVWTKL